MKNNLPENSLKSLTKQRQLLKGAALGFGIILLLAFCIILYVAIKKNNYALISIFPASMITLLPILIRYKQISKEINSRKTN
jgi:di/tricarboxylate transporter